MWATFFGLLALTCGVVGAPVSLCPKSCSCIASGIYLEARCQSPDFLKKSLLSPEQITAIVALNINNGVMKKNNPDLTHFHNLKRLSLSSNKLQHITTGHFPKSLEFLDLSQNYIRNPPQDLQLLPNLKEVNLFGNPISCSCDSLAIRDALLQKSVTVTKSVKCDSPEGLRGKLWLSVTCKRQGVENLFEDMQGDAPYEGSGSGEIGLVTTDSEPNEKSENWDTPIEEEFIMTHQNVESAAPVVPVTTVPETTVPETTEPEEVEGSGDEAEVTSELVILEENQETSTIAADDDAGEDEDEDYDYNDEHPDVTEPPAVSEPPVEEIGRSLFNLGHIRACNFNCSTPSPLQDSNDTDAAPDFFEGVKILVNDLGILPNPEPITTTTTTTTTTTERPTSPLNIHDEKGKSLGTDKKNISTDVEVIKKQSTVLNEKENINEEPTKQSNSTFIFLSVLLVVIICLVVYAIVKKRSMRRNQVPPHKLEEKEPLSVEMDVMKKKAGSETDKPNGTHETIPLMNGHNENQHKTADEILTPDVNDASKLSEEDDNVELRPKNEEQKNLLTPEAKRVTIKASEIPNSTPKTPILVTRHVNSDGSIVTTPNIEQRV